MINGPRVNRGLKNPLEDEKYCIIIQGRRTCLLNRCFTPLCVITALPEDSGNLFITITCRDLNPEVRAVARANRPEGVIRLKRGGTDTVISPSAIAGNRMALAAVKPASVAFVQTLVERQGISYEPEEIKIHETSNLANRELKDSRLREDYNTQLPAILRDDITLANPNPGEIIKPGDILIVFGPETQLSVLEKMAAGLALNKSYIT